MYFAWRRGEPTALDPILGEVLALWRGLADGDELVLRWAAAPAGRR